MTWWELTLQDFNHPAGSLKGIIAAAYSLGAIISLPFIPIVDNWVGRRGSIMYGSIIMIIGSIIQGFSKNGTVAPLPTHPSYMTLIQPR